MSFEMLGTFKFFSLRGIRLSLWTRKTDCANWQLKSTKTSKSTSTWSSSGILSRKCIIKQWSGTIVLMDGLYYFTVHDPTIHDPTMDDSCIIYVFIQTGARETAYFVSKTSLDNSYRAWFLSFKSKNLKTLYVISFQHCTTRFAARIILFV